MSQSAENTGQYRTAAVAGFFYPAEPEQLRNVIKGLMNSAAYAGPHPRAIIAPHAGYVYSGKTAAMAYASLVTKKDHIRRIVLLGPAHRVYIRGLAMCSANYFSTPLGHIRIDQPSYQDLLSLPQVITSDEAHTQEHSIEVHLPFLQYLLNDFTLVPLVVGEASADEVSEVLDHFWDAEDTMIVISSDLSHYHEYDVARKLDSATTRAIEHLDYESIGSQQACGCRPVCGLLKKARDTNMTVKTLDLCNSGDTAGSRDRVVGYGSYALFSP